MTRLLLFLFLLIPTVASAQWRVDSDGPDPMDDSVTWYAESESVSPFRNAPSRAGLRMDITVSCRSVVLWSGQGLLVEGSTSHESRWRFDQESPMSVPLWSNGDAAPNFLFVEEERKEREILSKIMSSNSVLVEIQWWQHGSVLFRVPLGGATDAINLLKAKCGRDWKHR